MRNPAFFLKFCTLGTYLKLEKMLCCNIVGSWCNWKLLFQIETEILCFIFLCHNIYFVKRVIGDYGLMILVFFFICQSKECEAWQQGRLRPCIFLLNYTLNLSYIYIFLYNFCQKWLMTPCSFLFCLVYICIII